MKKFYLLLGITALLTACSGGKTSPDQKEFTLTGKFATNSNDGKEIYLQTFDANSDKYVSVDTATVTNGSFSFTGIVGEKPEIRFISAENISKPALLVTEQGAVEMSLDTSYTVTIKGTDLNNKYQEYLSKRAGFDKEMKEISNSAKQAEADKKLTPELEAQLDAKYESVYDASRKYVFDFAKENIKNVLGEYILMDRGRSFDESQLQEILPLADSKLKEDPRFKKVDNRFQALQATAVGKNFVDLKGKTPDGKDIALSDYAGKGKYVLVDFWASWCPPCRKEMPAVVSLYNKYKSKGFEIVGVSLDKTNEDWMKGIKDLKITWPQISDLKYWQSDLSAAYAVNSIPHMVLIDKEGKIIARGINAHDLSDKLADLLK